MEINQVYFVKSSSVLSELPPADKPEYAFVGRSNVGKSSLINAITGHKDLAKTSSTPGKTQLINHFIVDQEWLLADLPGYGYARVSKSQRRKFEKMIRDYCTLRGNLISLFVLVDLRHPPQQLDLEFMEFLGESQVPFGIVFTKSDKLNQKQRPANLSRYKKELHKTWENLPPIFVTSSAKKRGMEELLSYMDDNMGVFYGEPIAEEEGSFDEEGFERFPEVYSEEE